MKNKKIYRIILIIICIIVILILGWQVFKDKNLKVEINEVLTTDVKILGNSYDLISFSVDPGDIVSNLLTVNGSVKGGYFFEGNILVNILDSNKESLRSGNGTAKSDWMTTGPVVFDANLDFTGLPSGPAFIEIHNDNPAGPDEGMNKSILIPIIIK
jgi:hypothetical protein